MIFDLTYPITLKDNCSIFEDTYVKLKCVKVLDK